jgi:hypothetical protein
MAKILTSKEIKELLIEVFDGRVLSEEEANNIFKGGEKQMNNFYNRKNGYGISLHEYNGNYALQEGNLSTDGDKVWPDFAFKSRWDKETRTSVPDTSKKPTPRGAYLGDKETAIDMLKYFLGILEGGASEGRGEEQDNIPF